MTAVPAAYGTGIRLICDSCGEATEADGCGLHDADVVYVAVTAVGWSGSPFARGPHRCPRCSSTERVPPRRPVPQPRPGAVLDRVEVELLASVAVVRVTGDIDMDIAPELHSALESAVAARSYVVVDLTRAGIIDSLGLGVLVRARNTARRRHGEILLAGPSRFVQTVLRTMRLHTAFRTFATVQQSVTAAGGPHALTGPAPATSPTAARAEP